MSYPGDFPQQQPWLQQLPPPPTLPFTALPAKWVELSKLNEGKIIVRIENIVAVEKPPKDNKYTLVFLKYCDQADFQSIMVLDDYEDVTRLLAQHGNLILIP